MQLRHLRYFLAVSDGGSQRAAEKELFVSQSAISRRIKELEEELGYPLFIRRGDGVVLTPAGAAFASDVRVLLFGLSAARRRAGEIARSGTEDIRFAIARDATRLAFVQKGLQHYNNIAPALRVHSNWVSNERLRLGMERGLFDAAIGYSELMSLENVGTISIHVESMMLAVPLGHPLKARRDLTLSELSDINFVWIPRSTNPRLYDSFMSACNRSGFVPRIVSEGESTDLLDMVSTGLGCAFVPSSAELHADFQHYILRRVVDLFLPLHLIFVWRKNCSEAATLASIYKRTIGAHQRLLRKTHQNWAFAPSNFEKQELIDRSTSWVPITGPGIESI